MLVIASFDPGLTTGYVVGQAVGWEEFELLEAGQFHKDDCVSKISGLFATYTPDHVVYEGFRLYEHTAAKLVYNDFPSVHVIGVIHACAQLINPDIQPQLTEQLAVVRKSVRLLDVHASYVVGMHHAKDAYLHMRYFLVRNRKMLFK